MIVLGRGQTNSSALLNWFLSLNSVPLDGYEIGFRVLDPDGAQVFPSVSGNYELVTSGDGHFGTGAYFAFDNENNVGWTPDSNFDVGQYSIIWRWKGSSGSSYQFGSESFLITDATAPSEPLYIPVSMVRDQGFPNPPTDSAVEFAIRTWQSAVEIATKQWFYPKTLELYLDGTDSDALHFGVPIFGIDELRINDCATALDPALYRVYNRAELGDRKNPRIKLVDPLGQERDIFSAPDRFGRLRFRKGRQNQYVRGTFGYTESDGSVPLLIQRAVLLLVIEKLGNPVYSPPDQDPIEPPPIIQGALAEEWTDGHRRRYTTAGGDTKPRTAGLLGLTSNPEVIRILTLFRAPIGLATPANPTYR